MRFDLFVSFLFLGFMLSACMSQEKMDEHLDDYMQRKNVEVVEQALEEIERQRREERKEEASFRLEERVDVEYEGAPTRGADSAPVVIVEFSDFGCPFTRRTRSSLEQLLEEYPEQVKIVFRHFPIERLREDSPIAHRAAMAAEEQGKFWEYHDLLFVNQGSFSEENLIQWADDLGMDVERFKKDLHSEELQKRLEREVEAAENYEVEGTPTFFLNGARLLGAHDYEEFSILVELLLEETQ